MSVISAMEAMPNRVRLLVATLLERPSGETAERLEAFCTPGELWREDVANPKAVFTETLRASRALGLVIEDGDRLNVKPEIRSAKAPLGSVIRGELHAALLNPSPTEEDQQIDFARATAWFLMQSPRRPFAFTTGYKETIKRQLGEEVGPLDLSSSARWNAFFYWCRYLGYGEALTGRALAPDPTRALMWLLPSVFEDGRDISVAQFLQNLALLTPVFEQGAVRRQLEDRALVEIVREPQRLSLSTSFALARLEQQGALKLEPSADGAALILDFGKDGSRRVSRIIWKGDQ